MTLIALCTMSFMLSWLGIWLLVRRFSEHLLDHPNLRSSHTAPKPRGGGIAFVGAFFLTALVAASVTPLESATLYQTIGVLLPLWLVGWADDFRGVSARIRYLVQLISATLLVLWFGSLPGIDPILTGLGDPWLGSILTVIAITALINFYNFMDGLDGIVGGTSLVQLAFFAWFLQQPVWWLLAAALLAFLWWNWPPAKIFMGDSGSTVLGGAVALALVQAPDSKTMWLAGAVTAPLVGDAVLTLLRRLIKRENIFEAHKSHIYQRLNQAGWSHGRVATTYVVLTLLIAAAVVLAGSIER
jgi:UDP-N-acetylmuramyl pentapeptide phosphotransferase/UDP-N-acetylglucosamine-1-phosphate transferase